VLPIVFVGLGLGSVAAVLIPTLAVLRPYLLGAGVLAVVAAWVIYARRRQACADDAACGIEGPARRVPIWLVLANTIVLLALIWQPWIEPLLLRWIR
jgi:mercuric ion transport protein